jgi:hypothetical protein
MVLTVWHQWYTGAGACMRSTARCVLGAHQHGLADLHGFATHSIHFAIPPASSMTFLALA